MTTRATSAILQGYTCYGKFGGIMRLIQIQPVF